MARKCLSIQFDGHSRKRVGERGHVKIDQPKCNKSKDLAQDGLRWPNRIHIVDLT